MRLFLLVLGAIPGQCLEAWAEGMLRQTGCLSHGATCSFNTSKGCLDHESCGRRHWCDDAHDCQPCSRWDSGDLSASVTAAVPEACIPSFRPDPCWMLRSRGCPCAQHGCFRAIECVASHLCEGSDNQALPMPHSAAIVTSLCHRSGSTRKTARFTANFHFLKLLLMSLARVRTTLPIYTMVCEARNSAAEVRSKPADLSPSPSVSQCLLSHVVG